MSNLESPKLLDCTGLYVLESPNCSECPQRTLCEEVNKKFVPKKKIVEILQKVKRIEEILKGEERFASE